MATYLETHRPKQRQFRKPRRAKPTGLIVVHTAESTPDNLGADGGAEGVANFIANRSDYGSYHDLCDSDSIVHLVPYDAEAYGDGTGSNPYAYHVSGATQAHQWRRMPKERRDEMVRNMARAAARYAKWVKKEHGITVPAQRVSKAASSNGKAGFISHGERDPGRRTDPGRDFDWTLFLQTFKNEMGMEQLNNVQKGRAEAALALKHLRAAIAYYRRAPKSRTVVRGVAVAWRGAYGVIAAGYRRSPLK